MRRKPDIILPIEESILNAAIDLRLRGVPAFHGFLMATQMKGGMRARLLTAYGTLYKALIRMEKAGLLVSRWEDPSAAARENRPRRRLYEVTSVGEAAWRDIRLARPQPFPKLVTEPSAP
jgi:PadR family transcriptional regulator, regulatory protein PadR